MGQPITVTIRKSLVGVLLIYLAGALAFALLFWAALMNGLLAHQPLGALYGVGALFSLLITGLAGIVYGLSYIHLDPDGMTVVSYSSLFVAQEAECLFRNMVDVQRLQPGILAAIFGYDTLTVETAGTVPNLRLKWVPDGERWATYLIQQSQAARTPVSTQ